MNTRLFLAGALVFLAGINSDDPVAWVVWAFGLAMVVAAILPPLLARLERPQIAPGEPNAASGAHRPASDRYWPFQGD
ncbi:hypothetical protein I5G62_gp45 [Mycobacterium phage CRB2]|uniref:Uncharacterized protein n=1 Tax=Mycobacterium phage CRB2 TaxID=2483623 RepID=A0A455M871_9CAUD|nr:hypothetical protein I5G62_gp45 [Mycobacterium phage CRB2]AYP70031.1 hypothetical protein CRB2_45 [Mycobacterium phage CRB2]